MRKTACAAALVLACASVSVLAEDLKADKTTPDLKAPETKKPKEKKEKPEDKKSEEKKPKEKKPETWTPSDIAFGAGAYWSASVFNSGADGTFVAGTAKYVLPVLPNGIGWFISADVGHWFLGTSDHFYAVPGFPGGIPYKSYTTWDAGLAFLWKP